MAITCYSKITMSERRSLVEPVNEFMRIWRKLFYDEWVNEKNALQSLELKNQFEKMTKCEFNAINFRKFMRLHRRFKYYDHEIRTQCMYDKIKFGGVYKIDRYFNKKESFR